MWEMVLMIITGWHIYKIESDKCRTKKMKEKGSEREHES